MVIKKQAKEPHSPTSLMNITTSRLKHVCALISGQPAENFHMTTTI